MREQEFLELPGSLLDTAGGCQRWNEHSIASAGQEVGDAGEIIDERRPRDAELVEAEQAMNEDDRRSEFGMSTISS